MRLFIYKVATRFLPSHPGVGWQWKEEQRALAGMNEEEPTAPGGGIPPVPPGPRCSEGASPVTRGHTAALTPCHTSLPLEAHDS